MNRARGQDSAVPWLGAEDRRAEEDRSPLVKIPRGLYKFARRKPLGAFGGALVFLLFFLAVFGAGISVGPIRVPAVAPYHYNAYELRENRLQGPSPSHIMGTDQLGRDIFSRLVYGARISVFIGLGVFAISTLLSTSLTLVSAYYIRSVDLILH